MKSLISKTTEILKTLRVLDREGRLSASTILLGSNVYYGNLYLGATIYLCTRLMDFYFAEQQRKHDRQFELIKYNDEKTEHILREEIKDLRRGR